MFKYCFQGLRHWRSQKLKKIDRSDEEKKESFGTQLGRSTYIDRYVSSAVLQCCSVLTVLTPYNCRGSLRSGVRQETGGTPPAETSQQS